MARFESLLFYYRTSLLGVALSWWWQVLLSFLPKGWISTLTYQQPRLLFRIVDNKLLCVHTDGEECRTLTEIPFVRDSLVKHNWQSITSQSGLASLPYLLVLPRDKVLVQTVVVPIDAEKNLHEFFAYEMDRLTPVGLDEVYYDFQVKHRDRLKSKVTVQVFIILRETLDDLINTFKHTQIGLHGVDIVQHHAEGRITTHGINLLPSVLRAPLFQRNLWINVALALAALCFLVTTQVLSLQFKHQLLTDRKQTLTELKQSITDVTELKDKVEAAEHASYFVMNQKLRKQSVTKVLYRLTQTLPDTTYLLQLHIKNNEVELHGLSTSAAGLVPLLEKSPWFNGARLRASITQDKQTGKERYKIKVNIDLDALNQSEDDEQDIAPVATRYYDDSVQSG